MSVSILLVDGGLFGWVWWHGLTEGIGGRVHLDAYARRHEGQKIYLRQAAAQRWVEWRDQILMGGRPHAGNQAQLRVVDEQLRTVRFSLSLSSFTIYSIPLWNIFSSPFLPLPQTRSSHRQQYPVP